MLKTFGEALTILIGDRTHVAVAEKALGHQASEKKRRDFANYLSKIALDKVPNIGLAKLGNVAKGLDYQSLAAFFSEIEHIQRCGFRTEQATVDTVSLKSPESLTIGGVGVAKEGATTTHGQESNSVSAEAPPFDERTHRLFEDLATTITGALAASTSARTRRHPSGDRRHLSRTTDRPETHRAKNSQKVQGK